MESADWIIPTFIMLISLFVALIIAFATASLAREKGFSFAFGFWMGFLFSFWALIIYAIIPRKKPVFTMEKRKEEFRDCFNQLDSDEKIIFEDFLRKYANGEVPDRTVDEVIIKLRNGENLKDILTKEESSEQKQIKRYTPTSEEIAKYEEEEKRGSKIAITIFIVVSIVALIIIVLAFVVSRSY